MMSRYAPATLAAVVTFAFTSAAAAVDVDGDRKHDFVPREQPYYPYANVGANCDAWRYNSPDHGRLTVRPPFVRGINGYGSRQRVAWRARFIDTNSGDVIATGPWEYARTRLGLGTAFNGGPNAPQEPITTNAYWAGSQYYDHIPERSGYRIRAVVDAGWQHPRTKKWKVETVRVRWVLPTYNRTNGMGYPGTPQKDVTC